MADDQMELRIKALELSFNALVKHLATEGHQRLGNAAKRQAVAAAADLYGHGTFVPAQIEALFHGVKSDRTDGT